MLALWLGDGDEHRALESDTTALNVERNLYLFNMHKENFFKSSFKMLTRHLLKIVKSSNINVTYCAFYISVENILFELLNCHLAWNYHYAVSYTHLTLPTKA